MPTTTPNLGLASGMATDDYVQPSQWNRIVDSLDRLVEFFQKMTADGAFAGWSIQANKTVGPGEGNIDGKWCVTNGASAVSGLTNDALNYIFGRAGTQAAPDGVPSFLANTTGTKEAGDIYLGTITLDAAGNVLATNDTAPGVDRNCFLIEIRTVAGSGTVAPIPPGGTVDITVDHATQQSFNVLGAISCSVAAPEFAWEILEEWAAGWFKVRLTNEGSYGGTVEYVYTRKGLI